MTGLEVLRADGLVTVQDRGRIGYAHLGVPRGGALDAPAAALANRLVGNDPGAAVLETTLGGLVARAGRALTLAVTGAECPLLVGGRARPLREAVSVPAGTEISVGAASRGVRSYLAVAGGLDVEPVLGSRSTDTLSWLGPPPVRAGQRLPLGPGTGVLVPADVAPPARASGTLRITPGPRLSWYADDVLDRLCASPYAVTQDSNRIGLRLAGTPLARVRPGELPSEGLVLGAVQVPADGQPLVFLADHPTTGGYPVVAVVDPDDLWQCAQLRPGETVRFSRR